MELGIWIFLGKTAGGEPPPPASAVVRPPPAAARAGGEVAVGLVAAVQGTPGSDPEAARVSLSLTLGKVTKRHSRLGRVA